MTNAPRQVGPTSCSGSSLLAPAPPLPSSPPSMPDPSWLAPPSSGRQCLIRFLVSLLPSSVEHSLPDPFPLSVPRIRVLAPPARLFQEHVACFPDPRPSPVTSPCLWSTGCATGRRRPRQDRNWSTKGPRTEVPSPPGPHLLPQGSPPSGCLQTRQRVRGGARSF